MPIDKHGKLFFPNDEITGVNIEFYHVPKNEKNGGEHKFGIRVVLPEPMRECVDWDKAKEDEEYRKSFAADSLMMHVDAMEKSLAMHPDCVEVIDFYQQAHDVSGLGLDTMMKSMMEDIARSQYDEEVSRGIVPTGMSFEDWTEVAGPDKDMDLGDWTPSGDSH
jgi:hypothetical protein